MFAKWLNYRKYQFDKYSLLEYKCNLAEKKEKKKDIIFLNSNKSMR